MTEQPLVVFPDAVGLAVDFLRDVLPDRPEPMAAGVQVVATVPNPRPPVLVQLRPAGGTSIWPALDRPRVDALIWHHDNHSAAGLAALVRGLLIHRFPGHGPVRVVRDFLGPIRNRDESSGSARYLLTVEITLRGNPA